MAGRFSEKIMLHHNARAPIDSIRNDCALASNRRAHSFPSSSSPSWTAMRSSARASFLRAASGVVSTRAAISVHSSPSLRQSTSWRSSGESWRWTSSSSSRAASVRLGVAWAAAISRSPLLPDLTRRWSRRPGSANPPGAGRPATPAAALPASHGIHAGGDSRHAIGDGKRIAQREIDHEQGGGLSRNGQPAQIG